MQGYLWIQHWYLGDVEGVELKILRITVSNFEKRLLQKQTHASVGNYRNIPIIFKCRKYVFL